MKPRTRVLLLPGWQNSGPNHWQSHWETRYGDERVPQADWQHPRRGDWMAQLEETLLADHEQRPTVLVAHSLGCHLVAAWAAHSQHTARITGALLVAAPDTTQADWPAALHNWRQPVRQRLPFASVLLASGDDPFCTLPASQALAQDWGSAWHHLGPLGHINSESGLGAWPEGRQHLEMLGA